MSKDIRSYFVSKKEKVARDDDSDVIPESPTININYKKKQSKRRQILEDSDDEIFTKKNSSRVNNDTSKSKQNKTPSKSQLQEVKASDMFSAAPIKRTEPLVKKEKKKTEKGIHSDDEFEKSLLEIDEFEEVQKNKSSSKDVPKPSKTSPVTQNNAQINESVKLSNKLDDKESRQVVKVDKKGKKRKVSESPDVKKEKIETKKEILEKVEKKKDFREFLENNISIIELDTDEVKMKEMKKEKTDACEPKQKKQKLDKSHNESVLTDEERHERKRHSAALYQKYLNRSGPKNLGSKEIPEGAPNCLKNYAFLLTGVLDSFERDEVVAAVVKYGGVVKTGISKKVTHVIAGEDAGPAKLTKAEELGIRILNEDEFLKMISNSLNNKALGNDKSHKDTKDNKSRKRERSEDKIKKKDTSVPDVTRDTKDASVKKEKVSVIIKEPELKVECNGEVESSIKEEKMIVEEVKNSPAVENTSLMWVDKYKPQNVKQIIGQHGDASNVKKLTNWLSKWYANRKAKLPKPSPWAKNDDGGYYKAALLSGPPGVGKTTTVSLVLKELGFDAVEFNASDTRSKTLVRQQIGELLTTTTLAGYASGMTGKGAVSKKHVLVMDEVDGMAGNEDRGGLQELISLIKSTAVPVVCMCNDRGSEKMRTLLNYCYELRFSRPRVDQIKAAMMSICFKEGLKVPGDVMSQLIAAAGQDVRQTLHLLSMWAADGDRPDRLRSQTARVVKDVKMGPWEAIRKALTAEELKTMSIGDKSDLFFTDYSLMPLFVQENYLSVTPSCPKHEVLQRMSRAADSISLGDLVDARIRRNQAWGLLPVQAIYSTVIPGHEVAGHMGQIQFPGWLGRNSRASRMQRLAQQIHAHTRLSTSGSKSSIFLDYGAHLRDAIVGPLIDDKSDGIDRSLDVLESYHLLREDLDSLTEISLWPGQRNPTALIEAKVKAAMTRTYNKKAPALPYAPGAVKKGRAQEDSGEDYQGEEYEENREDSDPENDALIKKKKKETKKNTEKASTSKGKSSSGKEKKKCK